VRSACACALSLLAACSAPALERVRLPDLDRAVFEREVQPILASQCANPTCHGRPERPLSLFAPGRFRRVPEELHLPGPLTPEELDHNYRASVALAADPAPGDDALLARKPLAGGGLYHGGGAVFDGPTDRSYRTLRAWMETGR
jgi:hypothetical protein